MTITSTASRSLRIGNETPLSGNESLTSELGEQVNSIIPAATDDHPVTIGAFTKANLSGLLMTCNRDVLVRMYGGNPWDIQSVALVGVLLPAAPPRHGLGGTITINGDLTEHLFIGDLLWITNLTAGAADDDTLYFVVGVVVAAGVTTVEVIRRAVDAVGPPTTVFSAAQPAAAGEATKVVPTSRRFILNTAAANEFLAVGAPGQIAIGEDLSFLEEHDRILVQNATTHGNDQLYTVVSAVYTAPDTVIIVEEALGAAEAGLATTTLMRVVTQHMVRLTAGIPYLWTLSESLFNTSVPVLEDITTLLVSNADATLTADFQARIIKVPV